MSSQALEYRSKLESLHPLRLWKRYRFITGALSGYQDFGTGMDRATFGFPVITNGSVGVIGTSCLPGKWSGMLGLFSQVIGFQPIRRRPMFSSRRVRR